MALLILGVVLLAEIHAISGECGKPEIQGTRVVGGETAVRGSWPWQILMSWKGEAACGGAIISPQWVVTAAHCVSGRISEPQGFTIRVGEHDRDVAEGSEVDMEVEKVVQHRSWNVWELTYDIAMFKLKNPIQFNKYVSPVCLPSADVPVGTKCFMTGWGKTQHPGSMASILQQGELPVVSRKDCYEKNKKTLPVKIYKGMVCAGSGGSSPTSACHGDSGGPFVCNIDGRWELHGSSSHTSPICSSAQTYTVFARTFFFKSWILKQMEDN